MYCWRSSFKLTQQPLIYRRIYIYIYIYIYLFASNVRTQSWSFQSMLARPSTSKTVWWIRTDLKKKQPWSKQGTVPLFRRAWLKIWTTNISQGNWCRGRDKNWPTAKYHYSSLSCEEHYEQIMIRFDNATREQSFSLTNRLQISPKLLQHSVNLHSTTNMKEIWIGIEVLWMP